MLFNGGTFGGAGGQDATTRCRVEAILPETPTDCRRDARTNRWHADSLSMMTAQPDRIERRARDWWRTPVLFVSHGSPLVTNDEGFKQTLRRFGLGLGVPRAVVAISAHWTAMRPIRVTASRQPERIRDYAGFPAWVDAGVPTLPGAPAEASRVATLLNGRGLGALLDQGRGLDSAVWLPLALLFPGARIPTVQVSLPAPITPEEMLAIGEALAPLRRDGVVLLASGGIVHNEARARFDQPRPPTDAWAMAFDSWMRDRLEADDTGAILNYRRQGPMAHLAAPTSEHLDPLFFALGSRLQGDRCHVIYEGFHGGILSLRTFAFAGRRQGDLRLPPEWTLRTSRP